MTFLRICVGILALTASVAIALGCWGACVATRHVIVAVDRYGEAGLSLTQTLQRVNGRYGAITETDKLLMALKSTTVHIDMAARHENANLTTLDGQEATLFSDVHGTMTEARGTLKAGAGTLTAATEDLQTMKPTLAASTYALKGFGALVDHADSLVTSPHVQDMLASGDVILGNSAAMTTDASAISHHYATIITAPVKKKWYTSMIPPALDAVWKVWMAAHTP